MSSEWKTLSPDETYHSVKFDDRRDDERTSKLVNTSINALNFYFSVVKKQISSSFKLEKICQIDEAMRQLCNFNISEFFM